MPERRATCANAGERERQDLAVEQRHHPSDRTAEAHPARAPSHLLLERQRPHESREQLGQHRARLFTRIDTIDRQILSAFGRDRHELVHGDALRPRESVRRPRRPAGRVERRLLRRSGHRDPACRLAIGESGDLDGEPARRRIHAHGLERQARLAKLVRRVLGERIQHRRKLGGWQLFRADLEEQRPRHRPPVSSSGYPSASRCLR